MNPIRRIALSALDAWVDFGVFRPFFMIGIWLALVGIAVTGLSRIRVETSGDSILDKASPLWARYQRSLDLFGNDEVIVAAIAGREPYDPAALRLIMDASRALESIPGVRRVDSISTLPIIEVIGGSEVRLEPALTSDSALDAVARADIGRRVGNSRIANRNVVSEDGRVFAINVWPESGIESSYEILVERVRRLTGAPNAWVSGVPVFRTEVNLSTNRELGIFVPVTVAVMVLLLFVAFQSARAVVVPLLVSGVSVCLLGGFMGWFGIPLSAPTVILPPVLLAVGCAYTMHLLSEVEGRNGSAELAQAIKEVSRPIALSGITTVIGFASTAIVPIEAVQRVGVLGSLGTLVAFTATIGLGSAVVSVWRGAERRNSLLVWLKARAAPFLLDRVRSRTRLVILLWAAVFALGVFGAQRLHVESDVVVWFPRGTDVRDAYEDIKAHLSGISPINIVVSGRSGATVTEPSVINAIDRLSDYISALPEVGKVLSVADPLRELHAGFGDETFSALPADRASIEQYLLLLEGTDRLGDVITADRGAANILVRADNNGSRHLLDIAESAEAWWREHGAEGFDAYATGSMFEIARSEEAISLGQTQSLGLDILIIAMVLLVALGSLRLAVLALVPNVLPVGLMFGFMGLTGIPLDLGTVFVSNLAVGIAVDETIHLVTAFRRDRGRGRTPSDALRAAMATVVPALLLTTLVIAAGFLVLALSDFRFTRNLGLLTAAVMFLCVASNVTLLPALLLRYGSRSGSGDPQGAPQA